MPAPPELPGINPTADRVHQLAESNQSAITVSSPDANANGRPADRQTRPALDGQPGLKSPAAIASDASSAPPDFRIRPALTRTTGVDRKAPLPLSRRGGQLTGSLQPDFPAGRAEWGGSDVRQNRCAAQTSSNRLGGQCGRQVVAWALPLDGVVGLLTSRPGAGGVILADEGPSRCRTPTPSTTTPCFLRPASR